MLIFGSSRHGEKKTPSDLLNGIRKIISIFERL